MSTPKRRIGIAADDITGANDVGVMFSKNGYRVKVMSLIEKPVPADFDETDVLVIGAGAAGVTSAYTAAMAAWKAGDLEGAKKAQFTCFDLVKKLRYGADMSIFKHVLDDRGVGGGHAKAPLLDLEESAVEPILEGVRPYYNK